MLINLISLCWQYFVQDPAVNKVVFSSSSIIYYNNLAFLASLYYICISDVSNLCSLYLQIWVYMKCHLTSTSATFTKVISLTNVKPKVGFHGSVGSPIGHSWLHVSPVQFEEIVMTILNSFWWCFQHFSCLNTHNSASLNSKWWTFKTNSYLRVLETCILNTFLLEKIEKTRKSTYCNTLY